MKGRRGSEQVWKAMKLKRFLHLLRGGGTRSRVLPRGGGGDRDEVWLDSGL